MKFIITALLWIFSFSCLQAQNEMETVFEKSKGAKTSTYQEAISYYEKLAQASPYIKMMEMGETDSGYPLHLVLLDVDKEFDIDKAKANNKAIILINNGIHPGEPDGVEASMMLLRDYAFDKKKRKSMSDIIIGVIPIYNIGGALNRNEHSRANQNGPESYGFRGNARNYDLNRDFIKADSKNAKAFFEIYQWLRPDVFIDTHVSNGADYQYVITHLATQHDKIGGEMGDYIYTSFTPALEKLMKQRNSEITPYVNVFNTTPDAKGIEQFMDYPRYSTGYTALFNTLGFMIETHMLKSFEQRVTATYNFLDVVKELTVTDKEQIIDLHNASILKPGDQRPLNWQLEHDRPDTVLFKGYEGEYKASRVSGLPRLYYDRKKPFERMIPYYTHFKASVNTTVPQAYIVPQGWSDVIDRLKWSGIMYEQITADTTREVHGYIVEEYETVNKPYEGHYRHYNTKVKDTLIMVRLRKGDYIFSIEQPGGRFLLETLEPQAPDSYFNWNFFDTILQQKEHFSPYVFEDVAADLLNNNPQLKGEFETLKKQDADFAKDGYKQLKFVYEHSPYREKEYLRYPVFRLMKEK